MHIMVLVFVVCFYFPSYNEYKCAENYDRCFRLYTKNIIPSSSVTVKMVSEKGPMPTAVSAAIFTETFENFFTPTYVVEILVLLH